MQSVYIVKSGRLCRLSGPFLIHDYLLVCNKSNTTGITNRTGNACSSGFPFGIFNLFLYLAMSPEWIFQTPLTCIADY